MAVVSTLVSSSCLLRVSIPTSSAIAGMNTPRIDDVLGKESITAAEQVAEELLAKRGRLADSDILKWLECLPFPDKGRKVNAESTRGFCVGAVRNGPFSFVTRHSSSLATSCKVIQRIAAENVNIAWTACQLNKGINLSDNPVEFQSAHCDTYSHPDYPQALRAFGHFSGGEIAVAEYPPNNVQKQAMPPSSWVIKKRVPLTGSTGKYCKGQELEMFVYDIKNEFLAYNPHALHVPLPFRGIRFSMVFFLSNLRVGDGQADFNSRKQDSYLQLGFPLSSLEILGIKERQAKRAKTSETHSRPPTIGSGEDVVDTASSSSAVFVLQQLSANPELEF